MSSPGFWRLAGSHPQSVAIVDAAGRAISAGTVLAMANRLVHGLRAHGLRLGDTLALAMGHRSEFLELYFAALQAGWYVLPLNPSLPAPELEATLKLAKARLLFFDQSCQGLAGALSSLGRENCFSLQPTTDFRLWNELWEGQSNEQPEDRLAGERVAVTSGTTGLPKIVRPALSGLSPEHLGKRAALHLKAVCGILPESGAVHLVASPLYHSASLLWCGDHLHLGHTVILMSVEGWDPEQALAAMERHKVTGTLMVPTHFFRLRALPQSKRGSYNLSSLRHVVHTGAPCPPTLKKDMLDWWGPVITEVYGAAEGPGTRVGPQEWLQRPGTVGQAHGRVRIERQDGTPCDPDEVGRVCLKGLGGSPTTGFGSVGDLGYLDSEGNLFLVGREDDVILSGGVNIHPVEIESVLTGHPEVADAAVVGVPDQEWGERLSALVVPKEIGSGALAERLRSHCAGHLAAHKCPRDIEWVKELPRDLQGKLRRRELGPDS